MKYHFSLYIIKDKREMVTLHHHIVFTSWSTFITQINVPYYFKYQDANFFIFLNCKLGCVLNSRYFIFHSSKSLKI